MRASLADADHHGRVIARGRLVHFASNILTARVRRGDVGNAFAFPGLNFLDELLTAPDRRRRVQGLLEDKAE